MSASRACAAIAAVSLLASSLLASLALPARAVTLPPPPAASLKKGPSCWRGLAASFRDGDAQFYRPLLTLKPKDGGKLEFDWAMRLGEAQIGARRVIDLPLAVVTPKGHFDANAEYWNVRTKRFEICAIPQKAFRDKNFQRDWTYGGFRLDLNYGDTLEAKVTSTLDYSKAPAESRPEAPQNGGVPCQATNLHTHGLLVSPAQRADGTIGDYVLNLAEPAGSHGDQCADAAAGEAHHMHGMSGQELKYRIEIGQRPPTLDLALQSPYHPPGVFWFHPHPHGYSAGQLRGGASGMITIGGAPELQRYAPFVKNQHNLRHLILRDAQIGKQQPSGVSAALGAYDSGLCGDKAALAAAAAPNGGYLPGECAAPGGESWLFTVNGISLPEMSRDIEASDSEVWRILNASANASYRLALRPLKNGVVDPAGAQHCFRVIARDGAPAPEKGQCELLLMPGARAEIAIDPAGAGEAFALVSEGVDTNGDFWPPVMLARVAWPNSPPRVAAAKEAYANVQQAAHKANAALAEQRAIPATPRAVALRPAHWTPPQKACDFPDGSERVVLFVKKPGLNPDRFNEVFGLVAGLRAAGDADWRLPGHSAFFRRDADGKTEAVDFANVLTAINAAPSADGPLPNHAPAFSDFPVFSDICVEGKHSETWVLENWTDELHNFHIHQTRFQLAAANALDGKPDQAYFATPFGPRGALPACGPQDDAASCVAPADAMIAEAIADALDTSKTPPHHDSIPVPRGSASCAGAPASIDDKSCQPGRISVTLAFDRDEQRGEHGAPGVFPYHCHILEHEDLGMMGLVTVK